MSSPFGHSLAGYLVVAFSSKAVVVNNFRVLLLCAFVANAPDLDFIPGMVIGKPNLFHHGISHSLGAGILLAFLLSVVMKGKGGKSIRKRFLLFFSLYCSHLLLDYVSQDGRAPIGIPLFWPFSQKYYIAPYPILPPIMHAPLDNATIDQFLSEVFSAHNLYVVFFELATVLPAILIVMSMKLWFNRKH